VIQALSLQASYELNQPLANGIGHGAWIGVFNSLLLALLATAANRLPYFLSRSRIRYLDRSLADLQAQLEQFTANSFGSPEPILASVRRHSLEQVAGFLRDTRLSRLRR
jgi:hypothetical protein